MPGPVPAMPALPHDWGEEDWTLVAHALARAARDSDVEESRALELLAGVAAREGCTPAELVR